MLDWPPGAVRLQVSAVAQRIATIIALAAVALAPSAFSFGFTSFLHAKELVYAVAMVVLGLTGLFLRPAQELPNWLLALTAWLLAVASVSLLQGNLPYFPLEKLGRALLVVCFCVMLVRTLPIEDARWKLRLAFLLSAELCALLGLLQYLHLIDWLLPVYPTYDQRMYSVFGNQDLLGGYLALALPFTLTFSIEGNRSERLHGTFAVALLGAVLLLSQSRSAWLAAALAIGLYVTLVFRQRDTSQINSSNQIRIALLMVFLGAITAPWWWMRVAGTFSASDVGGNLRLWFYAGTRHMFWAHPLLGVGFGTFGFNSPYHMGAVLREPGGEGYARNELFVDHAHCDPLEAAAEVGIAGLVLALALCVLTLRGCSLRKGAATEIASLLALGTLALLNPVLASPPHALLGLCCIVGCIEGTSYSLPQRAHRGSVLVLTLLISGLWAQYTALPSRALRHVAEHILSEEQKPAEAGYRFIRYAEIAESYGGPPEAIENALYWATLLPHTPGRSHFLNAAFDHTDTGNAHFNAARYFEPFDPVRAALEYRRVLERWPWHEESNARLRALEATFAGKPGPAAPRP